MTQDTTVFAEIGKVDYDPLAENAMVDARPVFAQLRAYEPVKYLDKYNAWALSRFEDVWQVVHDLENFTCKPGMHPQTVFYGDRAGTGISSLDPPEHRQRRQLLSRGYTKRAVTTVTANDVRRIAQEELRKVIVGPSGEFEIWAEYASPVAARAAGIKNGIPDDGDAIWLRQRLDTQLHRTLGQRGTSPENLEAAGDVLGYLAELVVRARADVDLRRGNLGVLVDAEVDGRPLTQDEIAWELMTLLVTGSDTTEHTFTGTVYYLHEHPKQLAEVQADPSLLESAFREGVRYDHPTNMLLRWVTQPVTVGGQSFTPGQAVLLLWGSANRDEREYPDAEKYDLHRKWGTRSLLFGHGEHRCLGENLAMMMGPVMLEELFQAIRHYEIDPARCERVYSELLNGYVKVPIRYEADTTWLAEG